MLIAPVVDAPAIPIAQRPCADEGVGVQWFGVALGGFGRRFAGQLGLDPRLQFDGVDKLI